MNIYNQTIPYFYIIRNKETGIMYAGSKWAEGCHPDSFMTENGYQTSSSLIHSLIKEFGLEIFEILRIDIYCDRMHVYDYESLFLQTNNCADSDDWYNNHNNTGLLSLGTIKFQYLMLEKYGYKHIMQVPGKREKSIKTINNKYMVNVINVSQIPEIKEKKKLTNLQNWGYEYSLQSPEIREKSKKTLIQKNGVDHPSKIIVSCPWCDKTGGKTGMTTNHFDNCKKNPNRKEKKNVLLICEHCGFESANKSVFNRFHSLNCRKNPNFINKEKRHKKHIFTIEHTCPHCNKVGKGASMFRFHFENCKFSPTNLNQITKPHQEIFQ